MRRSEDYLRATHTAFLLHANVGRVRARGQQPAGDLLIEDLHAAFGREPTDFFRKMYASIGEDAGARELFIALARTPGFYALAAGDAIVLLRCAAGPRAGKHAPAERQLFLDRAWADRRRALLDRLKDPALLREGANQQTELLIDLAHTPEQPAYFMHANTYRGRAIIALGAPEAEPALSWSRAPRRVVGGDSAARIESPSRAAVQTYSKKRIDLTLYEELLFVEWIEANHTINPDENTRLLPTRQKFFEPAFQFALRLAQRRGGDACDLSAPPAARAANPAAAFLAQLLERAGHRTQLSGQSNGEASARSIGPEAAMTARRR